MTSCGMHLNLNLKEVLEISVIDMSLEIYDLRLQLHLLGINELTSNTYHAFYEVCPFSFFLLQVIILFLATKHFIHNVT